MHDKSVYEVDYPDGTAEQLKNNKIDENILSQVDCEGRHYQVLTEVTDQKIYYSTITNTDGFIKSSNGKIHRNMMTHRWKILVECKDSSVYWVPPNELKWSKSVELAEYAMSNKIRYEPSFIWWVKETFCHQDRIIYQVKSKYWHT